MFGSERVNNPYSVDGEYRAWGHCAICGGNPCACSENWHCAYGRCKPKRCGCSCMRCESAKVTGRPRLTSRPIYGVEGPIPSPGDLIPYVENPPIGLAHAMDRANSRLRARAMEKVQPWHAGTPEYYDALAAEAAAAAQLARVQAMPQQPWAAGFGYEENPQGVSMCRVCTGLFPASQVVDGVCLWDRQLYGPSQMRGKLGNPGKRKRLKNPLLAIAGNPPHSHATQTDLGAMLGVPPSAIKKKGKRKRAKSSKSTRGPYEIPLEVARQAPWFDVAEKRFTEFHGTPPTRAELFSVDDGKPGVTIKVVPTVGEVVEDVYDANHIEGSNKAKGKNKGVIFVHTKAKNNRPLKVWDPETGLFMDLGGETEYQDWLRERSEEKREH